MELSIQSWASGKRHAKNKGKKKAVKFVAQYSACCIKKNKRHADIVFEDENGEEYVAKCSVKEVKKFKLQEQFLIEITETGKDNFQVDFKKMPPWNPKEDKEWLAEEKRLVKLINEAEEAKAEAASRRAD